MSRRTCYHWVKMVRWKQGIWLDAIGARLTAGMGVPEALREEREQQEAGGVLAAAPRYDMRKGEFVMGHIRQKMGRIGKAAVALVLLLAMLSTAVPVQTEEMPSVPIKNTASQAGMQGTEAENTDGGQSEAETIQAGRGTGARGEGSLSASVFPDAQEALGTEPFAGQALGNAGDSVFSEGQEVSTGQPSGAGSAGDSVFSEGQEGSARQDTGTSAASEDTVQNGLVQEGNRFRLYIDGNQVTKEGWQEMDGGKYYIGSSGYVTARMEEIAGNWRFYEYDINTSGWAMKKNAWSHVVGTDYYFNPEGACAKIYDGAAGQLSILVNGKMLPAANQVQALSDGKLYYFGAKGIRAAAQGWKKATAWEWYFTDSQGAVSAKIESTNGIWRHYAYQPPAWKAAGNTWKAVDGKAYYFGQDGKCTIIFTPAAGKCQVYNKGKMVSAKKEAITLQDGRMYYFNGKGKQVTKAGWQKVSGSKYMQVGKKGYVAGKLEKAKGIWKLYKYNYGSKKWELRKNTWERVDGKAYYFGKSGKCATIYDIAKKKCQKYTKGKMVTQKNTLCTLENSRIYYFSAKGVRSDKAGWKKISARQYVKVGKKGYVTHKISNTSGGWRYYKRDYRALKWLKQKKAWITVSGKKYYFNGKGDCTLIYYTKDKKCYDYKNGHMTSVRNDIRNISGKKIYFGADGLRVRAAGLYITSSGKLIYVNGKGYVAKEIRGIVMDYTSSNGKIISCKVKEDSSLCYYNGQGILTRKLDLKGKMVALTYDDGPSQYTSVILDVLGQNHAVATFFVLGERVSAHASIIKRAYQMGCEIGNHTYNHKNLVSIGLPLAQSQVSSTNTAVQGVTGAPCVVMRPPGGQYNSAVAGSVGMPLILWSIDTLDWKTRNAQSTQSAVLNHVKDGDIILMHDLYSPTAEASKVIIPELIRQGYQLVTVSELADCRGGMIKGMVYSAFR